MSTLAPAALRIGRSEILAHAVGICLRPLHALTVAPSLFFVTAMAVMLFRPPDYRFHSYDRYALALLLFAVFLRACVLRQPLRVEGAIRWPMLGLLTLALGGALAQPYQAETWSLIASKWLVPFALYWVSGHVFRDAQSLRRFETFSLVVLCYLSLLAILFMVGARDLIFPRYILDESLGIHADRARGPFLQAVANGMALNLLGLVALNSFRRGRLRGIPAVCLLAAVPLAILATRTRAVWLSFAGSILGLLFFSSSRRMRRACLCLLVTGIVGLVAVVIIEDHHRSLSERLEEGGPVKFRMAVYQAGWEMFLQRPLRGWGANTMQAELSNRISDFHQEQFYFHNTYLEILVQYGLVGLALYVWMVVDLFRLGRRPRTNIVLENHTFLDQQFRSMWPMLLAVYLVNGSFVVMNYQFVNGFLFTLAGMLGAQNQRYAEGANELAN
ncbi:MAG: O-antigen ligase family protein [Acidobacteriia bacterium]|nr:O-antigen ligase family protein [Terriglobia bacterium]